MGFAEFYVFYAVLHRFLGQLVMKAIYRVFYLVRIKILISLVTVWELG
jgi:hypothetical protein